MNSFVEEMLMHYGMMIGMRSVQLPVSKAFA